MGKSKKSRLPDVAAPGQPKVICFFCDMEFAEEGLLIQHQQSKHFKCTECGGFQGGRCPTHGCRHKCLVTLSCHYKKDHKGELKTIPGAKEGRDDPKLFWRVFGVQGVPEDFVAVTKAPEPVVAAVVEPPISEQPPLPNEQPPLPTMPDLPPVPSMLQQPPLPPTFQLPGLPGLPPIPDQAPVPQMRLQDLFTEWALPPSLPDRLPVAPSPALQFPLQGLLPGLPVPGLQGLPGPGGLPGLPGAGGFGGARQADSLPASSKSETPDLAAQVRAFMALKEAADAEAEQSQEQAPVEEQAPPISVPAPSPSLPTFSSPSPPTSSAVSFPISSSSLPTPSPSFPSNAFQSAFPSSLETIPADILSMETQQLQPPVSNPMPRRSRSRDRRSRSRDRRSRSRDRDRRSRSRSRDRQKGRGTQDRERQGERVNDDRVRRRSPDRGRGGASMAPAPPVSSTSSNAGRNVAIAITQGHIPSRIFLQGMMAPFGRLDYSHTGNRLQPERDPPWVLFGTSFGAEDAMKAITAGQIVDGNGVPIKAIWKNTSDKGKGKGKGKGDGMDISSRDLYRRGMDNRGARDGRR